MAGSIGDEATLWQHDLVEARRVRGHVTLLETAVGNDPSDSVSELPIPKLTVGSGYATLP